LLAFALISDRTVHNSVVVETQMLADKSAG